MNSSASQVRCVKCQAELDPAWSFCPDCGADNRAPEERKPPGFHSHVYPNRRHCIVCGQSVPDVDDMGRPVNRVWEAVKAVFRFFFWRRWWWWDD